MSFWNCNSQFYLKHHPLILVTIGSGNCFLPGSSKPLSQPMLTHCKLYPWNKNVSEIGIKTNISIQENTLENAPSRMSKKTNPCLPQVRVSATFAISVFRNDRWFRYSLALYWPMTPYGDNDLSTLGQVTAFCLMAPSLCLKSMLTSH